MVWKSNFYQPLTQVASLQPYRFYFSNLCPRLWLYWISSIAISVYFLIVRGFSLVRRVNEPFGFLLGSGIVLMISIQIIINLFVVTGLFPITGISLPFMSYGGSSLLTVMISLGILINITKKEHIT